MLFFLQSGNPKQNQELIAYELESRDGSYGLMIGRDVTNNLVVRHTEKGRPTLAGDR